MRLLEYQSKILLKRAGINTPSGFVISSEEELLNYNDTGPAVIKAQIPAGRRQKVGGVQFASSREEVQTQVSALLGSTLGRFTVEKVLIEEQIPITKEYYLAVTYDNARKKPLVLFSDKGGVDVEELAQRYPDRVRRKYLDVFHPLYEYQAREIIAEAGLKDGDLCQLASVLWKMVQLFLKIDATILEINPLVKTNNDQFVALDSHIDIDGDALFRHSELEEEFEVKDSPTSQPTVFEQEAAKIDKLDYRGVAGRMIEFDGHIGLLIGGGGASLTVFDAVLKCGGKPANYCEIGGNPSVRKLAALTKLLVEKKGANKIFVIMNVVNNTRVDLVARGVIKGMLDAGTSPSEKIAVFRVPGAWEEEGSKILRRYGINFCDRSISIDKAVKRGMESL